MRAGVPSSPSSSRTASAYPSRISCLSSSVISPWARRSRRTSSGWPTPMPTSRSCSTARWAWPQKGSALRLVDDARVDLFGQLVDGSRDVGVGLEVLLLLDEVVIGLRLLDRRLPVLADHDERR